MAEEFFIKSRFVCVFLVLFSISLFIGLYLLRSSESNKLHSSQDVVGGIDEYLFSAFVPKFQKRYETQEEYEHRFTSFKDSLSRILKQRQSDRGFASYGITKVADMSQGEFEMTMLMDPVWFQGIFEDGDFNITCGNKRHREQETSTDINVEWEDLPPQFDWREKGVVGPVLNQGLCGSCYALSVVGVMESMLVISKLTRHLSRLSAEELLDCSNYTNRCVGGSPVSAMEYLCHFHTPIVSEKSYPLINENQKCQLKSWPKSGVVLSRITKHLFVTPKWIAWQIATHGPVVATVNAYPWIDYVGGVIQYKCNGEKGNMNHVVQIVGYNLEAEVPYYIIRNSWGPEWGEDGYLRVAMNHYSIACGIGAMVSTLDVNVV